ncbi:hypothetical protein NLG97_g4736 [Lecanicillium saksenae]|uniref:Uncharacterized protein n=1 Tax=Lecanicillium saksenae TaxID=468837 RepID=A0ACC1QVS2_9HYPO|nr:hypothetical protein NLG97_g4736 [Lecanicillium saksenae]
MLWRVGDHVFSASPAHPDVQGYQIVSKLGYGAYSTVWLGFDRRLTRHLALKILTADSYGQENDIFEIDILKHMRCLAADEPGARHILQLLDNFQHDGPNGTHACLVFPAMGPDVTNYSQLFPKRRIPAPQIKTISRQLLLGLSFLHDISRVIHTDTSSIRDMFQNAPSEVFRPDSDACPDAVIQSIQVSSAEEDLAETTEISVKIADFGTASWFDRHLTEWIQPPMLRAPEVILGAEWDYKIWELVEGQVLFDGNWNPGDEYSSAAHLAQMSALLG